MTLPPIETAAAYASVVAGVGLIVAGLNHGARAYQLYAQVARLARRLRSFSRRLHPGKPAP